MITFGPQFYLNNSTYDKDYDCVCAFTTTCICKICDIWKLLSFKEGDHYIHRITVKMNHCISRDFCCNLNINLYFEYKGKPIIQLSSQNIKYNEIYEILNNELQFCIGEMTIHFGKKQEINPIDVENLRIQNELNLIKLKCQIQNGQNIIDLVSGRNRW